MSSAYRVKDLEAIKKLCEEGVIPLSYSRVRLLCQENKFPGIKIANKWHTTRTLARGFFYKGANKAFRRVMA